MYDLKIIFAKDSKLSGRSFVYTKKSKGPSIEPCGTPARTGDQFEEWPLQTTLWNLSLRKLCVNCLKFLQSLVCIVIPRARPYQRLLRYLRSKLLLRVKDFDQNLHKYYGQLTAIDFHKSHLVEDQID